jgi:hypothetical protein
MTPIVVLAGLVVVPIVVLFVLRVNAALVFLSLCLGDILVQFVGKNAATIISNTGRNVQVTGTAIDLGLLVAPAVITTVLMVKTVNGHKKLLNLLPAAGTGLLTALLVVPLLSSNLANNILQSKPWHDIQSIQSGIVAASALICLFFLLLQRPKHSSEKESKHHKG